MHIHKVRVTNFRLLVDVDLVLENPTTVVVGRNNSGKTSLSEVMRRFLTDSSPKFRIEDFSTVSYDRFCAALAAHRQGLPDDKVRELLPSIGLEIYFRYDLTQPDVGPLADLIVDLDVNCNEALGVSRYELGNGEVGELFRDQPGGQLTPEERSAFFRVLGERIPKLYETSTWAQDPNDPTNRKPMPPGALHAVVETGFVNAQRGLDDTTARERDVLARVLEELLTTAMSPTAGDRDRRIAEDLTEAVRGIQDAINGDFSSQLRQLMNRQQIMFTITGHRAVVR